MAIYRRVMVRMWTDAKVMALSRPQPCGQALWFHLLTGEQTDIIPGLFKVGEAALAEQLGWPLDAMRDAMREVIGLGLAKVDWRARVVFIPKAIKHNEPNGPNTVASWAEAWDRVPECALKLEAWRTFNAYFDGRGEAFKKAWRKACPMPSGMPSPIQEQDQEQDQEQEMMTARERASAVAAPTTKLPSKAQRLAEMYPATQRLLDALPSNVPVGHSAEATTRTKVEKLVEQLEIDLAVSVVTDAFARRGKLFIGWYLDDLAAALRRPTPAERQPGPPDLAWLDQLDETRRAEALAAWEAKQLEVRESFNPAAVPRVLAGAAEALREQFTRTTTPDVPF